jgi:hypothetical protein
VRREASQESLLKGWISVALRETSGMALSVARWASIALLNELEAPGSRRAALGRIVRVVAVFCPANGVVRDAPRLIAAAGP